MPLSQTSIVILLVLWAAAMGLSGWALMQEPTDMGFTRGLNRIMGFLSWQLAALILSLGLWVGVAPRPKADPLRRMGRVPGWWSVLMLAAIVCLVIYTAIAVREGSRIPSDTPQPLPEATGPVD